MVDFHLVPERTALINVDLQTCFLRDSPISAPEGPAMQREFRVFFLSDGTAAADMPGASAAELQKASLVTLGFLFAQVLTVNDMIDKIEGAE